MEGNVSNNLNKIKWLTMMSAIILSPSARIPLIKTTTSHLTINFVSVIFVTIGLGNQLSPVRRQIASIN